MIALQVKAQTNNFEDVVYLKNGSIIHGIIIEHVPNQTLKIQTKAGNIFVYNISDVEKMTKEQVVRTQARQLTKPNLPKKPKKIYEPQSFIIGGFGMHPSQFSFYTLAGYVKKFGYYGKLKTNFNFNSDYDESVWGGENDELFLKDTQRGRFSITGGGMLRISNPLSLYVGLGYGSRWLNWISVSDEVCRVEDYSYKGIEVETGVIYKLKNDIYLNMGSSIGIGECVFGELNLGVGVNLEYLKSKLKKK